MAEPVFFDRSSAERIANAVRKVEIGDRSEAALRFRRVDQPPQSKTFRIATFTGAWAINATKTVTFKYKTATPNTAVVTNLFFPLPSPSGATDCAIAKDGTAWFLIDVPLQTATAVFVSGTARQVVVSATASQTVVSSIATASSTINYISDISVAASLSTANCSITVTTTKSTASASVISSVSRATASLAVVQSTSAVSVVTATFTAVFVSFKV